MDIKKGDSTNNRIREGGLLRSQKSKAATPDPMKVSTVMADNESQEHLPHSLDPHISSSVNTSVESLLDMNPYKEFLFSLSDLPQDLDDRVSSYLEALKEEINSQDINFNRDKLDSSREPLDSDIIAILNLSKTIINLKSHNPGALDELSNFTRKVFGRIQGDQVQNHSQILPELQFSLGLSVEETDRLKPWLFSLRQKESNLVEDSSRVNMLSIPSLELLKSKDLSTVTLPDKSHKKDAEIDASIKPFDSLLDEMIPCGISIQNQYKDQLKSLYDRIKASYDNNWQDKDHFAIHEWAKSQKASFSKNLTNSDARNNPEATCELIAAMDRANELVTGGHRLRDTQMLALLTFLKMGSNNAQVVSPYDQGMLCEVQTGEGKTTIVSLLAVVEAMRGNKVDIITSNDILAQAGVESKEDFYSIFGLSVATNNPISTVQNSEETKSSNNKQCNKKESGAGPRSCYTADIVYGSIGSFQFDYLKDYFLKEETRAGRRFDDSIVILDEVDSMLIDNGRHIAKLAAPFAGMESLRYVYIRIWQELSNLSAVGDHAEIVDTITNAIVNDYALIALIPKHLQEYALTHLENWISNAIAAKENYTENKQYIIKEKDGERVIVPVDYLNTGVSLNNTVWPNGLHQFLQLKHNLALTVETLTNSHISNMGYIKKYEAKNIYGMSGTLGSIPEKDLLAKLYQLDQAKIPRYKEKKFIEIEGKVANDQIEWLDSIIMSILDQVENNRAVLVICETIEAVKLIKQKLELFNNLEDLTGTNGTQFIKTISAYIDDDAKVTSSKLEPRQVIIATNIAGRGTDLETSIELEENGGLHVCVTFLPCNKRVEDQAFGRTARQGKNGTGQLVVKASEVESLKQELKKQDSIKQESQKQEWGLIDGGLDKLSCAEENLNQLKTHPAVDIATETEKTEIKLAKELRNKIEEQRISELVKKVIELEWQDKLFDGFVQIMKDLEQLNHEQKLPVTLSTLILDDLKEKWAFWLEENSIEFQAILKNLSEEINLHAHQSDNQNTTEQILERYIKIELEKFRSDAFVSKMLTGKKYITAIERCDNSQGEGSGNDKIDYFVTERIIHNPYNAIKQAEYFLEQNDFLNSKLKYAIAAIKQALLLGGDGVVSSYIKMFEAEIESRGEVGRIFTKILSIFSPDIFFKFQSRIVEDNESSKTNEENLDNFEQVNQEKEEVEESKTYKDQALASLTKANNVISREISYLETLIKVDNDPSKNVILLLASSKNSKEDLIKERKLNSLLKYDPELKSKIDSRDAEEQLDEQEGKYADKKQHEDAEDIILGSKQNPISTIVDLAKILDHHDLKKPIAIYYKMLQKTSKESDIKDDEHSISCKTSQVRASWGASNSNQNSEPELASESDLLVMLISVTDSGSLLISYCGLGTENCEVPYQVKWLITKYCEKIEQELRQNAEFKDGQTYQTNRTIAESEEKPQKAYEVIKTKGQEEFLSENFLVKHLYSRLVALSLQRENIDALIKHISDNVISDSSMKRGNIDSDNGADEIENAYGISGPHIVNHELLISRKCHSLSSPNDKNIVITKQEITELANIGLKFSYELKDVLSARVATDTNTETIQNSSQAFTDRILEATNLMQNLNNIYLPSSLANTLKKLAYIIITEGSVDLVENILHKGLLSEREGNENGIKNSLIEEAFYPKSLEKKDSKDSSIKFVTAKVINKIMQVAASGEDIDLIRIMQLVIKNVQGLLPEEEKTIPFIDLSGLEYGIEEEMTCGEAKELLFKLAQIRKSDPDGDNTKEIGSISENCDEDHAEMQETELVVSGENYFAAEV